MTNASIWRYRIFCFFTGFQSFSKNNGEVISHPVKASGNPWGKGKISCRGKFLCPHPKVKENHDSPNGKFSRLPALRSRSYCPLCVLESQPRLPPDKYNLAGLPNCRVAFEFIIPQTSPSKFLKYKWFFKMPRSHGSLSSISKIKFKTIQK